MHSIQDPGGDSPTPEAETGNLSPRPSGVLLSRRFLDLIEVVLAAFAGTLFAPLFLEPLGVSVGEALNDSKVLGLFLFADATCTIGLLWIMQRLRGKNLASLGWGRRNRSSELRIGFQVLPGLILLMFLFSLFFEAFLPDWVTEQNPLLALIQSPTDAMIFMAASIYAGGVKEELQRGFIIERFENSLGGAVWGIVVWSLVFGALHYTQGIDNAIKAGSLGLVLGILYWKRRRLEGPIIAHALFDVVVVLLVYLFPELAGTG